MINILIVRKKLVIRLTVVQFNQQVGEGEEEITDQYCILLKAMLCEVGVITQENVKKISTSERVCIVKY